LSFLAAQGIFLALSYKYRFYKSSQTHNGDTLKDGEGYKNFFLDRYRPKISRPFVLDRP